MESSAEGTIAGRNGNTHTHRCRYGNTENSVGNGFWDVHAHKRRLKVSECVPKELKMGCEFKWVPELQEWTRRNKEKGVEGEVWRKGEGEAEKRRRGSGGWLGEEESEGRKRREEKREGNRGVR